MADKDEPPKSSKKARKPGMTSGQLKAQAEKKAKAVAEAEKRTKAAAGVQSPAPKAPDTRELTIQHWARGRNDPLTRAFVSEHARVRTVKRTPAEWMGLYRKWLKQPR